MRFALTAWFFLGMLTVGGIQSEAQTGTGARPAHNANGHKPHADADSPKAAGETNSGPNAQKSPAPKSDSDNSAHEVPTLDSVSQNALKPMVNQEIQVKGIIGSYHQTPRRYSFHTNDDQNVEVIGDYPKVPNTTYLLNARVVHEGSKYVLSEIRKDRVDVSIGSGGSFKVDPLLLAGGLLLAAAAVTFIIMTARSKESQQKMAVEQQIEQERLKADAARQEAERLRAASNRPATPGGPGGTVVTSAPASANGSKAAPPARTIVSVGSVEAIAGPHLGQKFPLQHGETHVGRAIKEGILLDRDGEVSSRHGSLIVTVDGRVLYRDESTNGSLLDGKTVHHQQADAHSGSLLEIGASTLKITVRVAAPAVPSGGEVGQVGVSSSPSAPGISLVPPAPIPSGSPVPQASRSAATIAVEMPVLQTRMPAPATQATLGAELEVVSGPDAGQRFAITRDTMGLGREDQDILLNEDSISRKHATLEFCDGKFLLTDQHSTHGTKVNGDAIGTEPRELVNGDHITPGTGRTMLIFHSIKS